MLFSGFLMTRLTKLARLPNVTAYILAGILIGPYVLNLVPQRIIDGTDFLSDIALAFIAFSTGEFFKLDILKRNGMKVVWITILEAVLASVFIFILTYFVLRLDLAFSIVLAALASATAPASTMMTIRQTGAKGDFVDTLLQVVALDDVVGLVLYSVAISIALASLSGASGFSFETLGKPVVLNLLVVGLGSLFGLFMKLLMPQKRSKDNKLIISVALLFAFCGVCALLDLSPLLGCMMMGTVYTNIADDDKLFKQLNYFSPPILLLFFVRSGMSFQLDALVSSSGNLDGVPLLVIGVSYFLQNSALLIWKAAARSYPPVVTGAVKIFGGKLTVSYISLLTISACIVIMLALTLFVSKSKMGKAMRACSEDKAAAQLMGINVNATISATFAIGSALAAIAGVLLCSFNTSLMPTTGSMPGIKAFTAAVFGGIGSIPGAFLGGLLLGIIEAMAQAYISTNLANSIVFAVLIVVLLVKPAGLLGKYVPEKV